MSALTREILIAGKSDCGGWSKSQLELIGVKWPPTKGWMDQVIGKDFENSVLENFVKLKPGRV